MAFRPLYPENCSLFGASSRSSERGGNLLARRQFAGREGWQTAYVRRPQRGRRCSGVAHDGKVLPKMLLVAQTS
ncbi:hypothetical protein AK812_SmicGene43057 [Symbiodinium microadriaticum]|uniref:Uncharacterized protein n=1 Tax=Symbiodinium microadriaticum TaxID=2951 RepID=A0A1Q9C1Z5_SYMMI|nr:hypothetical protein AK812_SmicGene43057 [Symbiodinium microadriaticum]